MKIRRRYLLISLLLALLLGFAGWKQDLFFTYLVEPSARILWLIYRTLRIVDQEIYWLLVILAALILILRLIPDNHQRPIRPEDHHSTRANDRVAYWETLLKSAETSQNERLGLQQELQALHRSVGDLAEGNEEAVYLPPVKTGVLHRIRAAMTAHFYPRILSRPENPTSAELKRHVDRLLISMETQLEIHHDRISNHADDD